MTIFHSAALKLTAWYLSIIMALSIACSLAIFQLSRDQLINNTRRQVYFFNDVLEPSDFRSFSQLRQRQLDQGLNRLKGNLVLFNALVFLGGGVAAYALARRTLRPIEESLEAQKRFTADASHELRTPLTAMLTEIEVALRNKSLTKKEAIDQLKSNLEEVGKLKALSEGLLHLAASGGKQMLNQDVNLKKVGGLAVDKWAKTAASRKITIKTQLKPVYVHGDEQSLIDLVSILLDNAIKYSPDGRQVTLKSWRRGREAIIQVEDQGIGIKAEDLPRVFERFYRTDSSRSKPQTGGYGLGLSIAEKIADLHGGYIEVKSAPGKGAAFSVRLPGARV